MDGGNMVNQELVDNKRKQRENKINTYAATSKQPKFAAAVFIDQNGPRTTNKKMLEEVGYVVDKVTEENYEEVIYNLSLIGVHILFNETRDSAKHIASSVNNAINEELPECWGGPDMEEYIEILPEQT